MKNFFIILFVLPIFLFGHEEVRYVENLGQWNKRVLYKAEIDNGDAFFKKNSIRFSFYDSDEINKNHKNSTSKRSYKVNFHSYELNFLNSNHNVSIKKEESYDEYYNYLLGSDKDKWKSNVKAYKAINYLQLYDGVDCRFYSQGNYLKYDFIISPHSNSNIIALSYSGVGIQLFNESILIDLGFDQIYESKPYAYQWINNKKIEVKCNYVLNNNIVSFEFPNGYNEEFDLIIDPVLITATLSGSSATTTWGHSATYDNDGCIYTGARCFSSGYPTTLGAYQINFGGGTNDIAISKLDSSGSSLIWATYLGGTGDDFPHSLIVNSKKELCIYGSTTSSNYPTTSGAFDITYNGSSDIVISHLDSLGTSLIGSTYLGGSSNDGYNVIANNYGDEFRGEIMIDALDNIYIASFSSSFNFPTTTGAYQQSKSGAQDAIILKMNNNLSSLIWSTFIGSSGDDAAYGLRILDDGVYFTGAASSGFPTTSGSAVPIFQGGSKDGYVAKIDNNGNNLIASSFFGTSSTDQSFFIDFDKDSSIYLYGQNGSPISISSGCYGVNNSRQFISKFNNDLSNIEWQTVVGSGSSSTDFVPTAFLVDVCNNIYISGHGGLNTIPSLYTTSNALYTSGSFYLMQLSQDAANVDYATHFTGNHVDGGTSRFDPAGRVYQAVCSCPFLSGSSMTTTSNAYSTSQSGDCDIGVFKIDFETAPALAIASANPASGTAPLTITFSNFGSGTSFFWDFDDNGATSTLLNPTHTFTSAGTYYVQLIAIDSSSCNISDTLILPVTVTNPPCSISLIDSSNISCYGGNDGFIEVQGIGSTGFYSYSLQIFNTILNSWTEIANSPLSGTYTSYAVTFPNLHSDSFLIVMSDSLGCLDTLSIYLNQPLEIITNQNIISCDSYSWNGNLLDSTGTYYDTLIALNGCDSLLMLDLTINNSDTTTSVVSSCDSYSWLRTTYTSSGIYDSLFTTVDGCDSLVVLDLTINNSDTTTSVVSSCDSYSWLGTLYTSSGTYDSLFTTVDGCDSLIILDLIINPSGCTDTLASNFDPLAICDDSSCIYPCSINLIDSSNVSCFGQNDGFISIDGSGSTNVFAYSLQTYNAFLNSWTEIANSPVSGSYTTLPVTFPNLHSDSFLVILSDSLGCIDTLSIFIDQPIENITLQNETNCDSYLWNGILLDSTAIYYDTLIAINGCDSILVLDLLINNSFSDTLTVSICDSNYYWDGVFYDSTGVYTNIYTSVNACDSIVTLDLTINYSYSYTSSVTACDSFLWNGVTYYNSGIYLNSNTNLFGCDSLQYLDLLINTSGCTDPLASNYDSLAVCDDNSCIYSCELFIIDSLDISCFGYNNGLIEVHAVGINNNFNYRIEIYDSLFNSWIPVGQSPINGVYTQLPVTFPNLFAGCYQIIVTDSLTCSDTSFICLTQPEIISLVGNITNSTNSNNGSIELDSILGGSGSYYFSWSGPNGFISSNQDIYNLDSGLYNLIVTDDSLCSRNYSFYVDLLILGCTDSTANNFNPLATVDDSSCCYLNFYNDDITICVGDSVELVYSGSVSNVTSYLWSTGDTSSSLFVNPVANTTYWLTQISNGFSCSDTIDVYVSCLEFSPSVSVALSNLNCGLTDLSITVSQDSNEVDMDTAIFISDGGSFTISSMNIGDIIGNATITFGSFSFNSNLIVSSIISTNFVIVEAVNQSNGIVLGTFSITNLVGGGVEIIAVSPGDGNNYTNGNLSVINFLNVFDSPDNGFLTFTSNITSELGDNDIQIFPFILNCTDFSPNVVITLSDLNCGVIADLTITVSQDSNEVDMDTAILISDGGSFTISSLSIGDTVGSSTMTIGSNIYNADLVIDTILSNSQMIVIAIDQLTGNNLGTFTLTNLVGGGVEIIAVSPGDSNLYTLYGNQSTIFLDSIFTTSSSGLLTFTSTIVSELGDIEVQTSGFSIGTISSYFTIFRCESYTWNGNTFDSTGIYVDTMSSIIGCDSIVTLNLTIYYDSYSFDTLNVCDGLMWNGIYLDSSGVYVDTIVNSYGCDSIMSLNLTINTNDTSFSVLSCDTYQMNGSVYDSTGIYIDTLVNSFGCDSIVTIDLTINYSSSSVDSVIECDSYLWNGINYTTSGVYDSIFVNNSGCDSLATLVLSINYSSNSIDTVTACDSYIWNGVVYNNSGTYDSLFINSSGCDSLATLLLTINDSTISNISVIACDSFVWDGTTYDSTAIYTNIYSDINGCDSIVILDLIINNSSVNNFNITACGFYSWNGVNYDSTGIYSNLFTDLNGCDSLVIIDLTVNNITTVFDTVISCDTLLWNGNTYTVSGNYIDTIVGNAGCDSIVNLNLTILNSSSSTTFLTSCDTYLWNGLILNSSGLYDTIITNTAGCDSIVQLYLTIIPTIVNTINVHSCGSYFWNGNTYNSTGIYRDTLIAVSGCDSVVELDLIITPLIQINSSIADVDCYQNSSGSININILAGSFPYTYQWSNGAVSEDISNLLGDSTYTISIVDSSGCTFDTSFYVAQPTPLNVNENVINVSCFGGNDGSAELIISGGSFPYFVSWGAIDTFNLISGFYSYIVTDNNGCLFIDSVEITQPTAISVSVNSLNVSCFGYNDGFIEVNVNSGSGVPAYSYQWTGPNLFSSSISNIYNLFAGDYNLIVTDANGCIFDTIITLTEPANLPQTTNIQISNYSGYNIRCKGDNSGWVQVNVTGGYEPYTYLWSNMSTSDSIFGLTAGNYTLELTDSLGCVIIFDFPLIEPLDYLTSNIIPTTDYNGYNISCYSYNDGAVQALASGGVPNYSYYWNSIKLTDSIYGLSSGNYILTVYDKNNCESSSTITLVQPDSLYIDITSFTDTCSKGVGKSEVSAFGGVSPYSYLWNNGQTSSIVSNFNEGIYNVLVQDLNLCEVVDSTEIFNLPSPIIDFTINPENQRLFDQIDDPIVFIDKTNGIWQDIVSWIWDFDDGNYGSDAIAYHSYSDTGTYTILLTTVSEYNCIDTLTKKLIITDFNLYIPNAFTPFSTNDQLNEIFKAYGYGIKKFKMQIFYRWGEWIFTSESLDEGWDGTSPEGEQVPSAIYLYVVEAENIYGEEYRYTGYVKLIR